MALPFPTLSSINVENKRATSFGRNTIRLGRVVFVWWLASVAFSLLLVQPFEGLLRAGRHTATLPAFDPFVLLVNIERNQALFSTAVSTAAVVLVSSKLCAQVPHTWALVVLTRAARRPATTVLRVWRALPYVTVLSLIGDGVPWLALYVLYSLTGGLGWLLAAPPPALSAFAVVGLFALGVWVCCLTWFDLTRLVVASTAGRQKLGPSLLAGWQALLRAPLRLLGQSALTRLASNVCLVVAAACSPSLTRASGTALGLAWAATQAGFVLALAFRVWWLTMAFAQSLRPPRRKS